MAQVIPKTPANPSEPDAKPMIAGALIEPSRPNALASPVAVVRTHVGNSSGVYAYIAATLPLRKKERTAPDTMIEVGVALRLSQKAAAAAPSRQPAMVRRRSSRSLSHAPVK
jgi:hypothetical protein